MDDMMSCSLSVLWLATIKTLIAPAINWLMRSLRKVNGRLRRCCDWHCAVMSACLYVTFVSQTLATVCVCLFCPSSICDSSVLHGTFCRNGWNCCGVGWCDCVKFGSHFFCYRLWSIAFRLIDIKPLAVTVPSVLENQFHMCIRKHRYTHYS